MSSNKIPRVPAGTGQDGRRLWRAVLEVYELEEHELALLRQAVHTVDLCSRLQGQVEEEGVMVEGRAHPALVELRQQRIILARLIVALRVPMGEVESSGKSGSGGRTQYRGTRGVYGKWKLGVVG